MNRKIFVAGVTLLVLGVVLVWWMSRSAERKADEISRRFSDAMLNSVPRIAAEADRGQLVRPRVDDGVVRALA